MPEQLSLIASDNDFETLNLVDADIRYYANFISDHQQWFDRLASQIQWQQSEIQLYGKSLLIPRLNAWYGDQGAEYAYSGQQLVRNPWTTALQALKAKVEQRLYCSFNSVLANYYRNGNDGVSWHADDEPELGCTPLIASLSFGATRRFSLKPKSGTQLGERPLHIDLAGGSLLVMADKTQQFYHHQIAKTKHAVAGRINLTFRTVINTDTL